MPRNDNRRGGSEDRGGISLGSGLYKGTIETVMENECIVNVSDLGSPIRARIMFPYYSVDQLPDDDSFGHGIIYKPVVGASCIVTMIGDDAFIIGFFPRMNKDSFQQREVISDIEDLDQPYKTSDQLISEEKKNIQVNEQQAGSNEESYYFNDESKVPGDMGMVSSTGNKVMVFSFGLNLIQATSFCFRMYSRLRHTIKEGFKNFFRYAPNGSESWTNDSKTGSNYVRQMKHNFEDSDPIYTDMIGEAADGHVTIHNAKEGNVSITESINLEGDYAKVHSSGGLVPISSEQIDSEGRSITSKNQTIKGLLRADFGSTLKTQINGTVLLVSNGALHSMQGYLTTVKGKILLHLNPPQVKKIKGGPANGNVAEKAGKIKAVEALGKITEYGSVVEKNVAKARAGKVVEVAVDVVATLGPKVVEKLGANPPNPTSVRGKLVAKIDSAVSKLKLPEGVKGKVGEMAVSQGQKYATDQFNNYVTNTVNEACQDVVSEQSTDDILASVSDDPPDKYGLEDMTFKEDDMGPLMENHATPFAQNAIVSASNTAHPDDPGVTILEDKVAEKIANDIVDEVSGNGTINSGYAVSGFQGIS